MIDRVSEESWVGEQTCMMERSFILRDVAVSTRNEATCIPDVSAASMSLNDDCSTRTDDAMVSPCSTSNRWPPVDGRRLKAVAQLSQLQSWVCNYLKRGSYVEEKMKTDAASRWRDYCYEDICRMVDLGQSSKKMRRAGTAWCGEIFACTQFLRWRRIDGGWTADAEVSALVLRWRWYTSWHQLALTADRKAANRMQRGAHPNAIWTIGLSPTNGLYLY